MRKKEPPALEFRFYTGNYPDTVQEADQMRYRAVVDWLARRHLCQLQQELADMKKDKGEAATKDWTVLDLWEDELEGGDVDDLGSDVVARLEEILRSEKQS